MVAFALQKYKNDNFSIVDLSTLHSWLVHMTTAVNKTLVSSLLGTHLAQSGWEGLNWNI